MAETQEELLDALGEAVLEAFQVIYGRKDIGFALFSFTFGESSTKDGGPGGALGDYVSNGKRENMIEFMRELADRLEKGKSIGRTIGRA